MLTRMRSAALAAAIAAGTLTGGVALTTTTASAHDAPRAGCTGIAWGSKGTCVVKLQRALKKCGNPRLADDGAYGRLTYAALRKFRGGWSSRVTAADWQKLTSRGCVYGKWGWGAY